METKGREQRRRGGGGAYPESSDGAQAPSRAGGLSRDGHPGLSSGLSGRGGSGWRGPWGARGKGAQPWTWAWPPGRNPPKGLRPEEPRDSPLATTPLSPSWGTPGLKPPRAPRGPGVAPTLWAGRGGQGCEPGRLLCLGLTLVPPPSGLHLSPVQFVLAWCPHPSLDLPSPTPPHSTPALFPKDSPPPQLPPDCSCTSDPDSRIKFGV